MYVDHNVLQIDDKNMDEHRFPADFLGYGIHYSRPATGSRTTSTSNDSPDQASSWSAPTRTRPMAGALGMFAVGAGVSTSPSPWQVRLLAECPRSWASSCAGNCRLGALEGHHPRALAALRGARGGEGSSSSRERRATLSVTDRGTICNMITELGATAAVFPSDAQTREWLESRGAIRTTSRSPQTPMPLTTKTYGRDPGSSR